MPLRPAGGSHDDSDPDQLVTILERIAEDLERVILGITVGTVLLGFIAILSILRLILGQ